MTYLGSLGTERLQRSKLAANVRHSFGRQGACLRASISSRRGELCVVSRALIEYCLLIVIREGEALEVEQEALVWLSAVSHFGAALTAVVADAVSSFRRKPGLDSLTRIYKTNVGAQAFTSLELVLPTANVPNAQTSYLHIRQQLRSHVTYQVLKRLVDDRVAPPELRDTFFSIDLGL